MDEVSPEARERTARFYREVDWSKVLDPYGIRRHGPFVLEDLWAPDRYRAGRALKDLRTACLGDGSAVWPAAGPVAAVPGRGGQRPGRGEPCGDRADDR
jgi:hypothetical protein